MYKKFTIFITCLFILGCYEVNPPLTVDPNIPGSAPKLIDSFVVPASWSGKILPIFVEVSDSDGDLAGFRVEVSQLGGNMYDKYFVPLKNQDRSYAKGYLSMEIPKLDEPEYLRLNIYAVDKTGRRSRVVTHNVSLDFGKISKAKIPPRWKDALRNHLGHIFFEFQFEREGSSSLLIRR